MLLEDKTQGTGKMLHPSYQIASLGNCDCQVPQLKASEKLRDLAAVRIGFQLMVAKQQNLSSPYHHHFYTRSCTAPENFAIVFEESPSDLIFEEEGDLSIALLKED